MFKNYFKIAFRNLKRDKIYSFINIFGLAIGIACCLLILLFINSEINYDSFHEKADRIYRVNTDLKFGSTELSLAVCSDCLGPTMKQVYPEIEEYVRIYNFAGSKLVKKGDGYNTEYSIAYTDSSFFKVFSFPVISGTTDKAFTQPNSVVINETIARKYFGTTEAVDKYIETDENGSTLYKVTAVIKDMPKNSHLPIDMLFPIKYLRYDFGNFISANFHTYLLLRQGTDYKEINKKLVEYNDKYVFPYAQKYLNIGSREDFDKAGNKVQNELIPLRDIHLYSERTAEMSPSGTIQYVYIFSAIALFILFIACINFMNLTTARSANRAREVGIRKVLGTERKNLLLQFLSESTFMSLIAVVFAVGIALLVLPYFGEISDKEFVISDIFSGTTLFFLLVLPIAVGIIAGSYPALFLSRFMPAEILKGKFSGGSKSGKLRSVLVVFQFATSVILITGTIIIYNQLNYIQNKKLGYKKDQMLIIDNAYYLNKNVEIFKNEMKSIAGVKSATVSGFLPIPSQRNFNAFFKESTMGSDFGTTMQNWNVDYDYLETFGIELKEGRNFSRQFGTDSSAIILNETAVKQFGYTNPVGQKIYSTGDGGKGIGFTIIGVVKDFNFESLRQNIGSLGLMLGNNTGSITFNVKAADVQKIISAAETKWKVMAAGKPFSFRFLDEAFDEMYRAEKRVGNIALTFSVLAVIVACLGLFGLATFLAEQKTKEIGIRKVLGAPISSLLIMLSKEFLKWVIIANIIALPAAYYFMHKWLQDFAYRIDISWWTFILTSGISLLIALATVSFQAIKAALANPVESLKYE